MLPRLAAGHCGAPAQRLAADTQGGRPSRPWRSRHTDRHWKGCSADPPPHGLRASSLWASVSLPHQAGGRDSTCWLQGSVLPGPLALARPCPPARPEAAGQPEPLPSGPWFRVLHGTQSPGSPAPIPGAGAKGSGALSRPSGTAADHPPHALLTLSLGGSPGRGQSRPATPVLSPTPPGARRPPRWASALRTWPCWPTPQTQTQGSQEPGEDEVGQPLLVSRRGAGTGVRVLWTGRLWAQGGGRFHTAMG